MKTFSELKAGDTIYALKGFVGDKINKGYIPTARIIEYVINKIELIDYGHYRSNYEKDFMYSINVKEKNGQFTEGWTIPVERAASTVCITTYGDHYFTDKDEAVEYADKFIDEEIVAINEQIIGLKNVKDYLVKLKEDLKS